MRSGCGVWGLGDMCVMWGLQTKSWRRVRGGSESAFLYGMSAGVIPGLPSLHGGHSFCRRLSPLTLGVFIPQSSVSLHSLMEVSRRWRPREQAEVQHAFASASCLDVTSELPLELSIGKADHFVSSSLPFSLLLCSPPHTHTPPTLVSAPLAPGPPLAPGGPPRSLWAPLALGPR